MSGTEQYFLHSLLQLLNLFGIAPEPLTWVSTRNKVWWWWWWWWWWWMHSHLLNTLLKQLTSSTHLSNVRFPLAFPVSHFLWTYIYICLYLNWLITIITTNLTYSVFLFFFLLLLKGTVFMVEVTHEKSDCQNHAKILQFPYEIFSSTVSDWNFFKSLNGFK